MLKKKGLFFYNNRILSLNAKGILTYYDPKCQDIPKSEIDLNNGDVIVKLIGKIKDQLEIITKDQQYIFKVLINYINNKLFRKSRKAQMN